MPRSNFWDAVSQRGVLGQRWTPQQRMAGLEGEQEYRRSLIPTQAISRPSQEQAIGASYPASEGAIGQPVSPTGTGANIWGRASGPDTGFPWGQAAELGARQGLRLGGNYLAGGGVGAGAGVAAAAPADTALTGAMAYEANPLAANYGAYLGGEGAELGAEGAAAGSEGVGAGAGEIAGSTAGGWLALAYMAYRAWDNLTQGSHQNEPMRATRDIAYGGRDLASLLQGRPLDPEIGLTRYTQEPGNSWVDPGTTMLTAGRYGQENIPELYNYLHSISRGGNQGRGGNAPGWFLTGNFWSGDNYGSGRGEPTHITDEDVDNFLYAQGVTREQLSQALGYTPPDWATTTWSQWEPQMANQAIAAREQRVREGLATDADIQYYRDYANQYNVPGADPWSQISLEQSPFYQDYWTALQARDPNLPQQAVSLEEGV